MKKCLFIAFFVCASAIAASAQSVSGSIGNGTISRGKTVKGTVYLSLPAGLHANSSRPGSEYAIPTTVRASGKGIKVGAVSYPRGNDRKFDFSNETLNVYEGRTQFWFNVTVPANYSGSSIRINVAVKYQACTNEVCYSPKTKSVVLTARVN
jgi:hypothetical protein